MRACPERSRRDGFAAKANPTLSAKTKTQSRLNLELRIQKVKQIFHDFLSSRFIIFLSILQKRSGRDVA